MSSPTIRSLEHLRKSGWLACVVEKWIAQIRCRKDMFDLFDIVALRDNEIAFVQTTTAGNMRARERKIAEHQDIDRIRKSGATLLIHGWKKVKGRWQVKVTDVS